MFFKQSYGIWFIVLYFVQEYIDNHTEMVDDYKRGREKLFSYFFRPDNEGDRGKVKSSNFK